MGRRTALAVGLALLVAVPLIGGEGYFTHLAIVVLVFSILASSLNLLIGYTGLVSIAHAAFFGIGAYASGVVVARYKVPVWLGFCAAVALAALVAAALSLPSFRTRGIYYGIVTVAFQLISSEVFDNWYRVTGGGLGLKGIPRPAAVFQSKVWYYYLTLAFVLAVHFAIVRLTQSSFGLALMAIRDNETKALMLGLRPLRYKAAVFVIAAGFAGLAGSLYAHYIEYAHPDFFNFAVSIDVFLMVVLGGAGTLYGPPVGVLVVEFLREVLHGFAALRLIIFGTMLVLIILFLPQGVVPASVAWARRLRIARPVSPAPDTTPEPRRSAGVPR